MTEITKLARQHLEDNDAVFLQDNSVADDVMLRLGVEHVARCEALIKLIDPTLAVPTCIMLAKGLSSLAQSLISSSYMEGELVSA